MLTHTTMARLGVTALTLSLILAIIYGFLAGLGDVQQPAKSLLICGIVITGCGGIAAVLVAWLAATGAALRDEIVADLRRDLACHRRALREVADGVVSQEERLSMAERRVAEATTASAIVARATNGQVVPLRPSDPRGAR